MKLAPGTRVGGFEVVSLVGAGGMGEVYRARDSRLGRDVALKILPDTFALDAERLARFEREAHLLALLNHQNIAGIHEIEEGVGGPVLVLELVEGPTLSERLAQGPIPEDEALTIARQIATALEAAHMHGVVHRDLKPANIKLRPDGVVKVLDFGLAKTFDAVLPADPSESPTVTLAGMSRVGVVLGTAAYMAPEQARGRPIDKRADIWAFGCVLYEMLTGRRAFPGSDVSETLARVLERDPDWPLLRSGLSPVIRAFLRRCLDKDPARRLRDIGDIRLALDGMFDEAAAAPSLAPSGRWRRVLAGTALVVIGATAGLVVPRRPVSPVPVARFEVPVPNFLNQFRAGPLISISPDGESIFYLESRGDRTRILRRRLADLSWTAVPGTEGAESAPFFPADGSWMGFLADAYRVMRRVPLAGGSSTTVLRTETEIYSPSWASDGTILFGSPTGLWRVPEGGGMPEQLTKTTFAAAGPRLLPDGRHVIFHALIEAGTPANPASIEVLNLQSGARRRIVDGLYPTYVDGTLVFSRPGGSTWIVGFDAKRVEATGQPTPLPIQVLRRVGDPQLAIAANGTMVYVPGLANAGNALTWVDAAGSATPTGLSGENYRYPRISPDGRRLAVGIDSEVWVVDLERLTRTRLASGDRRGVRELPPITAWSPDGLRVTFNRGSQDPASSASTTLEWRIADASSPPEVLFRSDGIPVPGSWTRDGKRLAIAHYVGAGMNANRDIWIVNGSTGMAARPWLATPALERAATFSPDGRWIAYVSDESGQDQVYVQSYSGAGRRYTVSPDGGLEPVWARDGRQLFYRNGDKMMAVVVDGAAASIGQPRLLFEAPYLRDGSTGRGYPNYDVGGDGRFLMIALPAPERAVVVQNWVDELKSLAR